MRLLLMAWLVARPVASAATACLYAHGDASRRPRTCVDVRALSRQSPARCATRSLRHQVCAHADGELVQPFFVHAATAGGNASSPGPPIEYVVEHGVCRAAARGAADAVGAAAGAHECAARCAARLLAAGCRAWSFANRSCALFYDRGAPRSVARSHDARCASGEVDAPVRVVRDAVVSHYGTHVCPCRDLGAPCVVTTLACGADADEPLSTDAALRRARCAAPRSDAAVVSIAQQFGAATYHFLVEDLGRWLVARGAVPHHAHVRVAAPEHPGRARRERNWWQRAIHGDRDPLRNRPQIVELLRLTGVGRARIETGPGPFRLVYAPAQSPCEGPTIHHLLALRAALRAAAPTAAKPRVVVVRRAATRALSNHDALVAALVGVGIDVAVYDDRPLPQREILALFATARAVVAPHGAGLANIVVAPRRAIVVEVRDARHSRCFQYLAEALGLQWEGLASVAAPAADFMAAPLVAPVAAVVRLVVRAANATLDAVVSKKI